MAAEVSSMPVNGNYAAHHYNGDHHQQQIQHGNGQFNAQQPPYQPAASSNNTATATPASSQGAETSAVPKDEVGWFFVEQYYTTLSKSPDKLYLYYNKRSQFVHGNETDKVEVCVGQRAINDRMKDLDFEDCKVRITNVDSQASDQNIVIQVIGEISNKSQPHRKFTQTFVLATQTNGYFVLNDIFRFLIEEEDEAVPQDEAAPADDETQAAPGVQATPQPTAAVEAEKPKTLTSSTDPTAIEQDAQKVDKTIESKLLSPETTNGGEEKSAPKVEVSDSPERPTEPEPTPAASPPKQTPAQPAATSAPKPVIPKTWASLAASANKGPGGAKAAPAAQTQAQRASPVKPATVAPPTGPAAAKEAANAPAASREEPQAGETDEWTAVGGNHNRQQSRQVNGQQHQQHQPRPQPEGPQRRGFIKNVNESVTMPALREALEKIAKVVDLDISHAKNCAFVEFETPEGYNAVVAANPITVGSESLYVEERKVRAANGGFVPRGQFQGGRGGRGDFRGGRGGNAQQRGRGGQGGASRGARGGAQQQP